MKFAKWHTRTSTLLNSLFFTTVYIWTHLLYHVFRDVQLERYFSATVYEATFSVVLIGVIHSQSFEEEACQNAQCFRKHILGCIWGMTNFIGICFLYCIVRLQWLVKLFLGLPFFNLSNKWQGWGSLPLHLCVIFVSFYI